jgi:hypothetical protein
MDTESVVESTQLTEYLSPAVRARRHLRLGTDTEALDADVAQCQLPSGW